MSHSEFSQLLSSYQRKGMNNALHHQMTTYNGCDAVYFNPSFLLAYVLSTAACTRGCRTTWRNADRFLPLKGTLLLYLRFRDTWCDVRSAACGLVQVRPIYVCYGWTLCSPVWSRLWSVCLRSATLGGCWTRDKSFVQIDHQRRRQMEKTKQKQQDRVTAPPAFVVLCFDLVKVCLHLDDRNPAWKGICRKGVWRKEGVEEGACDCLIFSSLVGICFPLPYFMMLSCKWVGRMWMCEGGKSERTPRNRRKASAATNTNKAIWACIVRWWLTNLPIREETSKISGI